MYCPNCSQQQISDELRFCSRCGFPLSIVRQLIATGGVLEPEVQGSELSPAFIGVRKGVRVMLAGLLLTLVVIVMTAANEDFAVLGLVPFLCFVFGFARILYGVFREDRAPRGKDIAQSQVFPSRPAQPISAARNPELPTARFVPPAATTEPRRTAEIAQPSVTESTTRLLDEEHDSRRSK